MEGDDDQSWFLLDLLDKALELPELKEALKSAIDPKNVEHPGYKALRTLADTLETHQRASRCEAQDYQARLSAESRTKPVTTALISAAVAQQNSGVPKSDED